MGLAYLVCVWLCVGVDLVELGGTLDGRCGFHGWGFKVCNRGWLLSSSWIDGFERLEQSGIRACVYLALWGVRRHIFGSVGRMGRHN